MAKLYHLNNEIAVIKSSIIHLGIFTQDEDENGYIQNGTERGIALGISPASGLMLYMTTNADPVPVLLDLEEQIAWFETMGDYIAGGTREERVNQGIGRLREAVEAARKIFPSEAASEDLGWYEDQASFVEREILDDPSLIAEVEDRPIRNDRAKLGKYLAEFLQIQPE